MFLLQLESFAINFSQSQCRSPGIAYGVHGNTESENN